jgi:hypothetical protein
MKRYFLILAALVAAITRQAVAQEVINGSRQINGGISIAAAAGAGGVTANLLAAKDGGNPTAYVIPASGGCGSGIAAATASDSASFHLYVVPGLLLTAVADNTITAGHILIGGTTTPGRVRDSGETSRGNIAGTTCIVGVAQESKTAGQDVLIRYDGSGTYGALSQGGSYDPFDTSVMNWRTDFDCRQTSSASTGSGNLIMGCGNPPLTWVNRTGTATVTLETAVTDDTDGNHPSAMKVALDSTASALLTLVNVYGNSNTKTLAMSHSWTMQWVFYISSATNMRLAFGWSSSSTGAYNNGIGFGNDQIMVGYDSSVSPNWGLRTGTTSGVFDAQVSTGIPATIGWHKVRLAWDVALSKAIITVDGTAKTICAAGGGCDATLGTHIPASTTAMSPVFYFGAAYGTTGTGNYFDPSSFAFQMKGLVN